jgi:hypothetical protein
VTIIGTMTYSDVGVGGGPMPGGPSVSHPIAPGGPPPWVSHPIPPTVWPNPPGGGGVPPLGIWGGVPPLWLDNTLPQPQPPSGGGSPPLGIWGGQNPGMPGYGWMWVYSPVYGWVLVPAPKPPDAGTTPPTDPNAPKPTHPMDPGGQPTHPIVTPDPNAPQVNPLGGKK